MKHDRFRSCARNSFSVLSSILLNLALLATAWGQSQPSKAAHTEGPFSARERACSKSSNLQECRLAPDAYVDRSVDASVQQMATVPAEPDVQSTNSSGLAGNDNASALREARASVTSWGPQRVVIWSPVARTDAPGPGTEASLASSALANPGKGEAFHSATEAVADAAPVPDAATLLHRNLLRARAQKDEEKKRHQQRMVQKQVSDDCRRQQLSAPECRLQVTTNKVSAKRTGAGTFATSHQHSKH